MQTARNQPLVEDVDIDSVLTQHAVEVTAELISQSTGCNIEPVPHADTYTLEVAGYTVQATQGEQCRVITPDHRVVVLASVDEARYLAETGEAFIE